MSAFPGTFAFDEYGRPFIILREQEKQKRITGTDAIKVQRISIFRYILFFYRIHLNLSELKNEKKVLLKNAFAGNRVRLEVSRRSIWEIFQK